MSRTHEHAGFVVAATLAWLSMGCDAAVPAAGGSPIRLVDPIHRVGATSEPASLWTSTPDRFPGARDGVASIPRATIHDDTRYVLATHPRHVLAAREDVDPVSKGVVVFREPLGDRFAGAQRVFIDTQVWIDREKSWHRIPPFIHEIRGQGDDRSIELRLEIEDARPGSPATIWVAATRVPEQRTTRYDTVAFTVPKRARLDFAFGILEPAGRQGPVKFEVEACQADVCEPLFSQLVKVGRNKAPGWRSKSIELDELAGKRRSFRFQATPERGSGVSLPVWANPILISQDAQTPPHPSVILLSIDTLRRDHLEAYGYRRQTSPFMATELARRGAIFDNLVSEATTTDPSHMTLFTSLPALVHGISCCSSSLDVPVVTLAEAFRRQGYATVALTENGPLAHEVGFAIGFDRWVENKTARALLPSGQVELVFNQARLWLQKRDPRPFFLFLHTFQVHGPYTPEGEYRELFGQKERSHGESEAVNYDREIRYVDDQLAALFEWLDAKGVSDNTIVVILSDHGEELGEHGSMGHATLPYEQVLGVPLILLGPGVSPGIRSASPLHHVDIMPTLLELADIESPPHVRGQSFAPLLSGEGPSVEAGDRARVSVSWVLPDGFASPAMTIRRRGLKLIRHRKGGSARQLCFDLTRDPGETRSVCAERAEEVAELALLLDRYEEQARTQRGALRGGDTSPVLPAGKAPLDPDREAELRALGYID